MLEWRQQETFSSLSWETLQWLPLRGSLSLIYLKLQECNLQGQLVHFQGQFHLLWPWEALQEFPACDYLLTAFRILLKEKYMMSVLETLLSQLHSSCRNWHGYRFRTKTHPRTGGWTGKPETPCFPPSSSWEEYNAALRQPPRKLLGDQTLLLTIQKLDKIISNPLEKSGVSTTRSETSTPKGLSFPWSQVRAGKLHLLSDQKASKQKWEFLWMIESWQVRYLLCWQDSASGFNNTKTTSNCVTYPLTLGRLWVPGSVLWASDIFWTNQTIARLTMDSNSFRFNIANLLHR